PVHPDVPVPHVVGQDEDDVGSSWGFGVRRRHAEEESEEEDAPHDASWTLPFTSTRVNRCFRACEPSSRQTCRSAGRAGPSRWGYARARAVDQTGAALALRACEEDASWVSSSLACACPIRRWHWGRPTCCTSTGLRCCSRIPSACTCSAPSGAATVGCGWIT